MGRVAVVGSLNCDLVMRVPRRPSPGETIIGTSFHTFVGGKGNNQALACARAGASVTMIGRVGVDHFGEMILAKLAESGVDCGFVGRDETTSTGVADILVDADGQNSICVAPQANANLCPADIEVAGLAIDEAEVVLLQLEIPMATVVAAARRAERAGAIVVLNPAPAPTDGALPAELLSRVDVIVPNQSELELVTKLAATNAEGAVNGLRMLRATGIGSPIVTLGEDGALWLDEAGRPLRCPAFPVSIVDTTAAGDAFCGALAAALADHLPLADAIVRGCAAGALACTKLGAEPSLPTREAIDCLVQTRP